MKRLTIVYLFLLLAMFVCPVTVSAQSSYDTVTITCMGYICESPQGLVITYISDYELLLNWTPGADSNQTMYRGMYGQPVGNITDGFQVYMGTGNSTSHYVANVGYEPIYYKGWSQRSDGLWEQIGSANTEGNFMSLSFMYLGVIFLLIAMMVMSFIFKHTWLFFASAFLWFGVGVQQLITYYAGGPQATALSMAVGYIGIGMTVAMFTASFFVNPKPERPPKLSEIEQYQNDASEYRKQVGMYRSLGQRRPSMKDARRR